MLERTRITTKRTNKISKKRRKKRAYILCHRMHIAQTNDRTRGIARDRDIRFAAKLRTIATVRNAHRVCQCLYIASELWIDNLVHAVLVSGNPFDICELSNFISTTAAQTHCTLCVHADQRPLPNDPKTENTTHTKWFVHHPRRPQSIRWRVASCEHRQCTRLRHAHCALRAVCKLGKRSRMRTHCR